MNKGFYTKLAWTAIKKNKQLYYPYFIAGMTMVMVFYIFSFLAASNVVQKLPGKEVLHMLFQCGTWAVGLFSIPFLFYTNATLIKKRKKELGLYNILGMNKKNLFAMMFRETVISYGMVVMGGIFAGVLFSKIAELGLVNIMNQEVNYHVYVDWKAVLKTMFAFAGIYGLIFLNSLRQIQNNNPIELLHSDSVGERPPKSHGLLAIGSLILILIAYGWTMNMRYSTQAFQGCLPIAILITIGTFLLFQCASVFLCKLLQNNKCYYYKTSHFVTISSMTYRMKRNGASLASICVLVTLILVTLTYSVSFYAGAQDAIEKHYPYDMGISIEIPADKVKDEMLTGSYTASYQSEIESTLKNAKTQSMETYCAYSANMLALITDGQLDLSKDIRNTWFEPGGYDGWERGNKKIVLVRVLSLDSYNSLCQTSVKLNDNEVLVATKDTDYQANDIILYNSERAKVSQIVKQIPKMTAVKMLINVLEQGDFLDTKGIEQMFLIVPDLYSFMGKESGSAVYSEANYLSYWWEYDMSIPNNTADLDEVYSTLEERITQISQTVENQSYICYLKSQKGEKFYGLAGSVLFLMLMINVLFIFVTALIMYYKQISEGYEDQKRFDIMRKIGMTSDEIKKSIHSQMLTVFWLPLLVAGIHIIFTSQIVYLLLCYAVVDNKPLVIKVMLISYFLFAIVYTLVYMLTSKTYFRIVSRSAKE